MKTLVSLFLLACTLFAAAPSQAQQRYEWEYYRATLTGPSESPPNDSYAYGFLEITVDKVAQTMALRVNYEDLSSPVTAVHLHCCTAQPLIGVAPPSNPLPLMADSPDPASPVENRQWYFASLNLNEASSYTPAFVDANGGSAIAARDSLLVGMATNRSYFNVHTANYPEGEMRGFIVMKMVPEPSAWLMLLVGLGGVGWLAHRRPHAANPATFLSA